MKNTILSAIFLQYWQYSHYYKHALNQVCDTAAIKQALARSGPVCADSTDIYC